MLKRRHSASYSPHYDVNLYTKGIIIHPSDPEYSRCFIGKSYLGCNDLLLISSPNKHDVLEYPQKHFIELNTTRIQSSIESNQCCFNKNQSFNCIGKDSFMLSGFSSNELYSPFTQSCTCCCLSSTVTNTTTASDSTILHNKKNVQLQKIETDDSIPYTILHQEQLNLRDSQHFSKDSPMNKFQMNKNVVPSISNICGQDEKEQKIITNLTLPLSSKRIHSHVMYHEYPQQLLNSLQNKNNNNNNNNSVTNYHPETSNVSSTIISPQNASLSKEQLLLKNPQLNATCPSRSKDIMTSCPISMLLSDGYHEDTQDSDARHLKQTTIQSINELKHPIMQESVPVITDIPYYPSHITDLSSLQHSVKYIHPFCSIQINPFQKINTMTAFLKSPDFDLHLARNFSSQITKIEFADTIALRTLRLLRACGYNRQDILQCVALAVCQLIRVNQRITVLDPREAIYIGMLQEWHRRIFQSYCSFTCLNDAVMKLFILQDFHLSFDPEIVNKVCSHLAVPYIINHYIFIEMDTSCSLQQIIPFTITPSSFSSTNEYSSIYPYETDPCLSTENISSCIKLNENFSTTQKLNILDASQLQVQMKEGTSGQLPPLKDIKFGQHFTDHMLEANWDCETGWGIPMIHPITHFSLHPASSCLHYGLQVFEGLKAFKNEFNQIIIFRPKDHIMRFRRSCSRIGLPDISLQAVLELLKQLIIIEEAFIPKQKGYALYIRPSMISMDPILGISLPKKSKFFIICTPIGPYFAGGYHPIKVLADDQHIRSWPGGSGHVKVGGNYAPTVIPQQNALKKGCNQVLWLFPDGGNDYFITEAGTMNIFIYWKNHMGIEELTTFPLENNLILPGIIRDTIIQLSQESGTIPVTEKKLRIKEDLIKALNEQRIYEIFGTGTACIITPINGIVYQGIDYEIPIGKNNDGRINRIGSLAEKLLTRLQHLQYGYDPNHPWCVMLDLHH